MKNMIYILYMNMIDLDLNLLRAFDAIATEGSVTVAGERIGLSQPAMSNALARLRTLFGDPLFVRTPRGMRPTPFAQQLAQPVREALRLIQTALQQHAGFEPRSSGNTFRFYMSDIGEMVFLPGLLERVKRDAPGVKIEVLRIPTKDIHAALEAGGIDLAVGFLPGLTTGMRQQPLFREHYMCMLRADHPVIGTRISAKQFREAAHVLVSYAGTGHEVIEETFVDEGLFNHLVAGSGVGHQHMRRFAELLRADPRANGRMIGAQHAHIVLAEQRLLAHAGRQAGQEADRKVDPARLQRRVDVLGRNPQHFYLDPDRK